jgi:dihydrofolate reductase
MGKVIFNMSMSVDGFVAGLNDNPENGMGDGGMRLFEWYTSGSVEIPMQDGGMVLKVSPKSAEFIQDAIQSTGAGVWGRKTFNIAHAWGGHPPQTPCFILTHQAPQEWVYEGSPFIFVTDGIESAIRQAKQAAGAKDVVLCTATVLQQSLNAGLVDEIYVDVVPVVMGQGVRLFENLRNTPLSMEIIRAVEAPGVTHMGYRVKK